MASNRINSSIQAELDLNARISSLEGRAAHLEADFSGLLQSARDLATRAKQYVTKVELEEKSMSILEQILETDQSGRTILGQLKMFFNFVLAKMQKRRAEIIDITMLWYLLGTDSGVHAAFVDSLTSFGFKANDVEHLLVLLGMVYKDHMDMCSRPEDGQTDQDVPMGKEYTTFSDRIHVLGMSYLDIDVEKYTCTEDMKCWYVDDNIRQVARRAVAIVLCMLNMEGKTASTVNIVQSV